MNILIKKIDGLVLPKQAFDTDAGYDVVAATEPEIVGRTISKNHRGWHSIDYIEYGTNIFISPDKGFHVECLSRSSISKYNLVLANSVGLIDNKYRGEIKFRFKYIIQPEDLEYVGGGAIIVNPNMDKIYKIGDRIGQLVVRPTHWANFQYISELPETDRGIGGFGSTNK